MSSTNKTTNLELSQFLGSDSPKWLTDYNADMEKIDAGYQTVKAQADATDLVVGGHTSSISTLQDTVTSQGTAISGLRTDVTGNTGSINTINSLIGNGEPTTTDKTIIGAINEIQTEVVTSNVLSTTEKAVGVDVDGKTIYEKSYVSTTPISAFTLIDSSITTAYIDNLISMDGMVLDGTGYKPAYQVYSSSNSETYTANWLVTSSGLRMQVVNETINKFHLTIRYTKA